MAKAPNPRRLLAVGLGGAIGTLLRLGVSALSAGTPGGTLAVNLIGAALLGVLIGCARCSPGQAALVMTGLLGGFTTYSALALDILTLPAGWALTYGGATIIGGVTLALGGIVVGSRMRSGRARPAGAGALPQ